MYQNHVEMQQQKEIKNMMPLVSISGNKPSKNFLMSFTAGS